MIILKSKSNLSIDQLFKFHEKKQEFYDQELNNFMIRNIEELSQEETLTIFLQSIQALTRKLVS